MNKVFLGIGGNLGDRLKNIKTTINLIEEKISKPQKVSSIYISEPWGFYHYRYFTNAVVELKTDSNPFEILTTVKDIETIMKRIKTTDNYEGRTMDIDILFYNKEIIKTEHLTIPHPSLHKRLFVLLPLMDIAPKFIHPVFQKNIAKLLQECNDKSKIKKIIDV